MKKIFSSSLFAIALFAFVFAAAPVFAGNGNSDKEKTTSDTGHLDMNGVQFFNYCNGENVAGTDGFIENRSTFQTKGNRYFIKSEFRAHGKGEGIFTHAVYLISETTKTETHGDYVTGSLEFSNSARWKMDSKGPLGQDMFVVFYSHIVIGPDGQIKSEFNKPFEIRCDQ